MHDVSDEDGWKMVVEKVEEKFGPVNILVNAEIALFILLNLPAGRLWGSYRNKSNICIFRNKIRYSFHEEDDR